MVVESSTDASIMYVPIRTLSTAYREEAQAGGGDFKHASKQRLKMQITTQHIMQITTQHITS